MLDGFPSNRYTKGAVSIAASRRADCFMAASVLTTIAASNPKGDIAVEWESSLTCRKDDGLMLNCIYLMVHAFQHVHSVENRPKLTETFWSLGMRKWVCICVIPLGSMLPGSDVPQLNILLIWQIKETSALFFPSVRCAFYWVSVLKPLKLMPSNQQFSWF